MYLMTLPEPELIAVIMIKIPNRGLYNSNSNSSRHVFYHARGQQG